MRWPYTGLPFLSFLCLATAYEVKISDSDFSPQTCSGMWGGPSAFINVSFDGPSQGRLAMVIYEWSDNAMLGKTTSLSDGSLPKTYICTSDAVIGGFCDSSQQGQFILDLPSGKSINDTSFWIARVSLGSSSISPEEEKSSSFWDNPNGNPSIPEEEKANASPWRSLAQRDSTPLNPSPTDILQYTEPIMYEVRKTGYYCVAIVPVTVLSSKRQASTDVPFHPSYNGVILFHNTFDGQLPATDYPKVNFYFLLFVVYTALAGAWGWLCFKHKDELLPMQFYLSSLIGFLVIEMLANWVYYRYLNAHGRGTTSTVFLFVVAILDAGRNALSFFMLLVVSLGLSVVRESLGRTMLRCQILAGAHFIFGVLYAVGIVELELESTSALVLLLFVIPLAFTLSGFLMWIMYALNGTITELAARKQSYKLNMFRRLHQILMLTVLIIAVFFVVSSLSFSNRLAEDFAANTWKSRWWLLDGWLSLLYLMVFASIGYLWRPTAHNRRLAMSEELAQDEPDAEDYDMDALERQPRARDDDDDATLVAGRRGHGPETVGEDSVVFEIGDNDLSDDEDRPTSGRRPPHSVEARDGAKKEETEGLMSNGAKGKDD